MTEAEIVDAKINKCRECINKDKMVFCLSQNYTDCLQHVERNNLSNNECDVFVNESIKVMFGLYDYLKK